ncbi:hypothetical protein HYE82_11845 [Streptomyces sp. BR123]|uniref:hypothetical protein n=1 Tax=Streptomyces sp. BR123 TaxID=2749828 RepID=UPI0015C414C2|nr:hypothetical protein [Streptomyces sp. BR123]NXY95071.1 hypothetical protein [Streptomyces sp. BR123]
MTTWYQQSPATPQNAAAKRIRRWSGIAFVPFLPLLFLAKLAVLTTREGGMCLMYGGCEPFPGVLFLSLVGGVLLAFVVAMAARGTILRVALGVQLLLEAAAMNLVLAYP